MPGCALRYCRNTSKNSDKTRGITFHRFPRGLNNPREEWLQVVRTDRSEPNWTPNEHSCICSDHFCVSDFVYTKTGRKFLSPSAVPRFPSKYISLHPESIEVPVEVYTPGSVDDSDVAKGSEGRSWDATNVMEVTASGTSRGQIEIGNVILYPAASAPVPAPAPAIAPAPDDGVISNAVTMVRDPATVCCVFGCRNSVRENRDKEFFGFPSDANVRSTWLKLIRREDLTRKLNAGNMAFSVCSDHFQPDDYNHLSHTLYHGVVPNQNLPLKKVSFVYDKTEAGPSRFQPAVIKTEVTMELEIEPNEVNIPSQHIPVVPCIPPRRKTVIPNIALQSNRVRQAAELMDVDNSIFQASDFSLQESGPSAEYPKVLIGRTKKELFFQRATFSPVEHLYLPGEFATDNPTRIKGRTVTHVQTTKALLDHLNAPLKKTYETELKELKKRIRELERKMAAHTRSQMGKAEFEVGCDMHLDPKFARIVKYHINLTNKPTGNRYSSDFKTLALNLFYCSVQAYKFVEQLFLLPSRGTVKRNQIPIRTGINANLIESFKAKVDEMSEKEKMCTVCFDSMDLNKNLNYCVHNDFLYGLEEIDQVVGTEPAEYGTLIMARGLYSKWNQPISFAYLSEKRCYPELKEWLLRIIALLIDIGLNVKALVTDLETEFLDLSDVSVTEPFIEVYGRRVYQIFDVPLLFKSARDDFIQNDFHFDSKVAKWSHVLKVYNADKKQTLKLAPKITEAHVRPKEDSENDVKLAIQIFSRSVAAAMNFHVTADLINKKAKDTVEFIQMMNNLFDILNSQKLSNDNVFKRAYTGSEEQYKFLTDTLEYLQMLTIRDQHGNVVDERPKFVTGLLITIKSVLALQEELKAENFNYLLTKHLSKDCMKVYFDKVRKLSGHCCAKPTPIMFARSFRRLFLVNLVINTKGGRSEMNLKSTLTKISDYVKVDDDSTKEETEQPKLIKVTVSDYQKFWPTPSAMFTAGYLLSKCLQKHSCEVLIEKLSSYYNLETPNADFLQSKFKEYNAKNLLKTDLLPPPQFFVEIVEKMDYTFDFYLQREDKEMSNFGWNVYLSMGEVGFEKPCECFPITFLQFLFIRMKIFHTVRHYNRTVKPSKKFKIGIKKRVANATH